MHAPGFFEHDPLTEQSRPVQRVRLQGDGWHIEIIPTEDGEGVTLHASGALSPRILVRPIVANGVEVTTEASIDKRVQAEAAKLYATQKKNDRDDVFNQGKGRKGRKTK